MSLIHTDRGWKRLSRMYLPDLRQASRELPGASREEIVKRANEIKFGPEAGWTPAPEPGPHRGQEAG